jgi:OmpA-OmpF porin, OOP family
MKKLLFSLIALGFIFNAHAQTSNGGKKKTSLAIRFNALDFGSAQNVQNGSIGSTLNAKKWGQYASTTKSLGINYTSQYSDQVDFFYNLDLAIARTPLYAPNALLRSNEDVLTAVETGVNIKMFKGDYRVNPYVTAGLGVRSFAFRDYSAYAPVGLGLQIKTCKGSNLNITTTYSTKMSKSFVPSYNYGVSYSFLLN